MSTFYTSSSSRIEDFLKAPSNVAMGEEKSWNAIDSAVNNSDMIELFVKENPNGPICDLASFQNFCTTELIDSNGKFNLDGVQKFQNDLKLEFPQGCPPHSVVSIIGPQSSGKSTLLNHLFGTDFKEMDAQMGRSHTTSGIWVAKSRWQNNGVIILDTEGSDGAEREEDTKFEKQTALFALAISNTVIINMICSDLGRNNGAGWPLLKTVFQVMIRRFTIPRRVSLVFVLRDKTKSPLEKLERQLIEQVQKIWGQIPKPQDQEKIELSDHFNIKVEAMVNYEEKPEQFEKEVVCLKERIICCTASGDRIPASGFAEYAKKIWDEIENDKDLNLPSYTIMVAEIRCNEIVGEMRYNFLRDKSWLQTRRDAESGAVKRFGRKISSLIDNYISKYDNEALYFVESVRDEKRKQLTGVLVEVVEPVYKNVLKNLRHATMKSFKEAVDILLNAKVDTTNLCTERFLVKLKDLFADAAIRRVKSDYPSQQLDKLKRDMDAYIDSARHKIRLRDERKRELERHNRQGIRTDILQAVMGIITFIAAVSGAGVQTT